MRGTARSIAFLPVILALSCTQATHIILEPKQPVLRSKAEMVHIIPHVMTAHVEDAEAKVVWTVENPAIARVDADGTVHALSSGRTSVIAKWVDDWAFLPDHKPISASLPVEVLFVEKIKSDLAKVELSKEKGDPVNPQIVVSSYDGLPLKDRTLDYTVKDDKICRVDKTGQFWPIEVGETVITASIDNHSLDIPCIVTK
jgi:hypothetical protein